MGPWLSMEGGPDSNSSSESPMEADENSEEVQDIQVSPDYQPRQPRQPQQNGTPQEEEEDIYDPDAWNRLVALEQKK